MARKKAESPAPEPRLFAVLHSAVGTWPKDTILDETDLAGLDIDRLLGLGAIGDLSIAPEPAPAPAVVTFDPSADQAEPVAPAPEE